MRDDTDPAEVTRLHNEWRKANAFDTPPYDSETVTLCNDLVLCELHMLRKFKKDSEEKYGQ